MTRLTIRASHRSPSDEDEGDLVFRARGRVAVTTLFTLDLGDFKFVVGIVDDT